jgi:hypothetical protein
MKTKSVKHLPISVEPNRAILVGENEDILVVGSCQGDRYQLLKFIPQEITNGEWNIVVYDTFKANSGCWSMRTLDYSTIVCAQETAYI